MTGTTFKRLRESLELTQPQLAARLRVHPLTVSRWERGKNVPEVAALALTALAEKGGRRRKRTR